MTDHVLSQRHETQVQELSSDELAHVTGGGYPGGVRVLVADVNGDAVVDAADYVVWRKTDGLGR